MVLGRLLLGKMTLLELLEKIRGWESEIVGDRDGGSEAEKEALLCGEHEWGENPSADIGLAGAEGVLCT